MIDKAYLRELVRTHVILAPGACWGGAGLRSVDQIPGIRGIRGIRWLRRMSAKSRILCVFYQSKRTLPPKRGLARGGPGRACGRVWRSFGRALGGSGAALGGSGGAQGGPGRALGGSGLLRRKTCAVLSARRCALFRAKAKESTKGGGRRPPPFVEAAEGRLLCIGSEQSRRPSAQHSTCLASQP